MKKIVLILTIYITLTFNTAAVYAWDDCPKGKVNDPYPGDCARYIDTDNNGICDHSEPAPEDRVENKTEFTNEVDQNKTIEQTGVTDTLQKNVFEFENLETLAVVVFPLIAILIYVFYKKKKTFKS